MQVYRIETGKLAETGLLLQKLGTAWPDAAGPGHLDEQRDPENRWPHFLGLQIRL